jgi:predicted DCC family thiol-disulfide oxidoreductase YuxK
VSPIRNPLALAVGRFNKRFKHLVFYDGKCGFCDHIVHFLLKVDRHQQFVFAPLQGKTAAEYLQQLPSDLKNEDSLILIENYLSSQPRYYLLAQGAFRIAWLLGGKWKLIGWLGFLPGFLFNWAYRLVARYRYAIFSSVECKIPSPDEKERFLP